MACCHESERVVVRSRGIDRGPKPPKQIGYCSVVLRMIVSPENPRAREQVRVLLQPVQNSSFRRLADRVLVSSSRRAHGLV
jgi:hypothetical protein